MLRNFRQIRTKVTSTTVVGGYSKDDYQHVGYFHIDKGDVRAGCDSFGEDAFYVNTTGSRFDSIGVADGVGGWRNQGVDPSLFSSTLMRECLLASSVMNEGRLTCPKEILIEAIRAMKKQHKENKFSLLGSSTAITSVIDTDNDSAQICNLGDSGYMLIRNGNVISKSKEQTHYFNCPFQLSLPTPGYNSITDTPKQADLYSIESIQPNDILILASDGLFDNVSEVDILKALDRVDVETIKEKLVQLASFCLNQALDPQVLSPFALNARKEGYTTECGGKLDDLTMVITLFSS